MRLNTHMIASKGQTPALWTLQSTTFFTGGYFAVYFFKQQDLDQIAATENRHLKYYFTNRSFYSKLNDSHTQSFVCDSSNDTVAIKRVAIQVRFTQQSWLTFTSTEAGHHTEEECIEKVHCCTRAVLTGEIMVNTTHFTPYSALSFPFPPPHSAPNPQFGRRKHRGVYVCIA